MDRGGAQRRRLERNGMVLLSYSSEWTGMERRVSDRKGIEWSGLDLIGFIFHTHLAQKATRGKQT